jgi:hypothetical protein
VKKLMLQTGIWTNETKTPNKKSPDFSNLGFFVPKMVVTRLGVEPRTY